MTSTRDVQDMLGLAPTSGPRPKPSKKKPGPKPAKGSGGGWTKELRSLIGERAPPAHLLEAQPKFQKKRASVKSGPVRRWHLKAFSNDARTDHLLLRHWRRTEHDSKPYLRDGEAVEIPEEEQEKTRIDLESAEGPQYKFGSKYNPEIEVPTFDHATYEASLQSEDWTEDETRYLMDIYREGFGKWPVVFDRYEWDQSLQANESGPTGAEATQAASQPDDMDVDGPTSAQNGESNAPSQDPNKKDTAGKSDATVPRTMEDLKARFYNVSAALLALATPPTQMTASQYRLHEQMTRFSPHTEAQRKRFKEIQMTRSKAEKQEEEYLIAELRRIYFSQERVDGELRELRGRLDHSVTDDRNPSTQYSSSKELTEIFNRFIKRDQIQRPPGAPQPGGPRRSLTGAAADGSAGSPTGPAAQKKGSTGGIAEAPTTTVRQLGARAAAKNGLSTHDRVTSGVSFRSDRITKIRQPSKSAQVNNKIATVLAQVDVPEFVLMPTQDITKAMEKVVNVVSALVETRRGRERVEGEVKVLERMLGIESEKGAEDQSATADGPDAEDEDDDDNKDEDTKTDAAGEPDGEQDETEQPADDDENEEAQNGEEEDENEADPEADADVETRTYDEDRDGDGDEDEQAEDDAQGSPDDDENGEDGEGDDTVVVDAPSEPAAATTAARNKRSASVLSAISSQGSRVGVKRQKSTRK